MPRAVATCWEISLGRERSSRVARAEPPGLLGWLPQHKPPFGSHWDLALSSHRRTKLALDLVEVRKTGCEVVV